MKGPFSVVDILSPAFCTADLVEVRFPACGQRQHHRHYHHQPNNGSSFHQTSHYSQQYQPNASHFLSLSLSLDYSTTLYIYVFFISSKSTSGNERMTDQRQRCVCVCMYVYLSVEGRKKEWLFLGEELKLVTFNNQRILVVTCSSGARSCSLFCGESLELIYLHFSLYRELLNLTNKINHNSEHRLVFKFCQVLK